MLLSPRTLRARESLHAVEHFYATDRAALHQVCWHACGDETLAARACERAFARAVLKRPRFWLQNVPELWIASIALKTCRRRLLINRSRDFMLRPGRGWGEVRGSLECLPWRKRLIVGIKLATGLTEKEIAYAVGLPERIVSRYVNGAKSGNARERSFPMNPGLGEKQRKT